MAEFSPTGWAKIAPNIRRIRFLLRLSRSTLARLANVNPSTVKNLEIEPEVTRHDSIQRGIFGALQLRYGLTRSTLPAEHRKALDRLLEP